MAVIASKNMKTGAVPLMQSFIFDFNVQKSASTGNCPVGQYKTGVQLPNLSRVVRVSMYVDTAVLYSGGGTSIGLGVLSPSNLFGQNAVAAINWYFNFGPGIMDNSLDVYMTINGNAMTQGRMTWYIEYYLPQ